MVNARTAYIGGRCIPVRQLPTADTHLIRAACENAWLMNVTHLFSEIQTEELK